MRHFRLDLILAFQFISAAAFFTRSWKVGGLVVSSYSWFEVLCRRNSVATCSFLCASVHNSTYLSTKQKWCLCRGKFPREGLVIAYSTHCESYKNRDAITKTFSSSMGQSTSTRKVIASRFLTLSQGVEYAMQSPPFWWLHRGCAVTACLVGIYEETQVSLRKGGGYQITKPL